MNEEVKWSIKLNRQRVKKDVLERLKLSDAAQRLAGSGKCEVCGQFAYITELHHVLTMKDLVDLYLFAYGVSREVYSRFQAIYRTVWLCPTDHALLHLHYQRSEKAQIKFEAMVADYDPQFAYTLRTLAGLRFALIKENRHRLNRLMDELGVEGIRFRGDSV